MRLINYVLVKSLENKTVDFVDYVCKIKLDLFAIMETWLHICPNDDAIRNESCPVGYMLANHFRTGRRGGGIRDLKHQDGRGGRRLTGS